jgi:hypothetical protein
LEEKMVKKLLVIIVLLFAFANIASAQQDTVGAEVCAPPEPAPVDFNSEVPTTARGILGRVQVVDSVDHDGPFRGLGGETGLRDYTQAIGVVYDADGEIVDTESEEYEGFVGFVLGEDGEILNEPDYGGSLGFVVDEAFRAVAPAGTWFIIERKGAKWENLPDTAFVVVPGGELCFDSAGGHGWAYAGATPKQIVTELGLWFGPFSTSELANELKRVKWQLSELNSVLTLSTNPSDYARPEEDEEPGG